MNSGSLEGYIRVTKFIQTMLTLIGFNVLETNYHWDYRVVVMYMSIVSSTSFIINAIYVLRDDPREILKGLAIFGLPVKVVTLATTLIYYKNDIKDMHMHLLKLHRNCRDVWNLRLLNWVQWIDTVLKCQVSIYVGTGLFMVFFPLVYYLWTGEKMLLFTIIIPFVDPDTKSGFMIYCGYEVWCAFITVILTFSGDAVFVLLCFSAAAYLELVQLKCEHLSERLKQFELSNRTRSDENMISELLMSTVYASNKADVFIKKLCKVYNVGFLLIMFSSGLCLACCILAGKLTDWIIAFPLGFSLFYGIMVFSFIGTVLETKSSDLSTAIYNIEWHLLSPTDRRTILMMLRHSQRERGIKIMGSTGLNVETGYAIMKTIYSGYMMLAGAI